MTLDDPTSQGILKPDGVVNVYRWALDITTPIDEMDDDEIAAVMRQIGFDSPGSTEDSIGYVGIQLMLFLTLTAFPKFYERHGLSHVN